MTWYHSVITWVRECPYGRLYWPSDAGSPTAIHIGNSAQFRWVVLEETKGELYLHTRPEGEPKRVEVSDELRKEILRWLLQGLA